MTKKYFLGIRLLLFSSILFVFYSYRIFVGYSIFNIIGFSFGLLLFIFAVCTYFFIPFVEYDKSGYVLFPHFGILKKPRKYSWSDVEGVYSMWMDHWTNVGTKDGYVWIISSFAKDNYYDTLKDLLKYIPEEKFDKLTLKRAKSNRRFYLI